MKLGEKEGIFYKILNGLDHVQWKNRPERILIGESPVASNLRRGGICFRREPANICTSRNEFFLNRVIPLWNELPLKIREAKTLNSFKAGLDNWKLFITWKTSLLTIYIKSVLMYDIFIFYIYYILHFKADTVLYLLI